VQRQPQFEPGPVDRATVDRFERLADALPVGVLHVDAGRRIVYSNHRLDEVLGSSRSSTLDDVLATVIDADHALADRAFAAVLLDGVDSDIELRVVLPGPGASEVRSCALSLRALTSDHGDVTGAVVCVSDVMETATGRGEPRRHATFDTLTRCNDRASTIAALEAMVAAANGGAMPAVISVNLDHFHEVNDHHGRDGGDEFLGVVARRLHGAVREDDLVGRIGGDEFLVACSRIETAAEAMRKAITIAESLRHEIQLKHTRVTSQASIGVAWSSAHSDVATLLSQAESARDESKRRGAGRPVLFTASLFPGPPRTAP